MEIAMKRSFKRSTWVLAAALGFGALGAAAPWASAKAEKTEFDKIPEAARKEIGAAIHSPQGNGTEPNFWDLGNEAHGIPTYMARYTLNGKRMEIQVAENGKVLYSGET